MGILVSTPYPLVLKSRQQQTSAKWMCTVSLPPYFLYFLLTLSLISGFRNVLVQHLSTDKYICATLIRQGLMPCAPYSPSAAISIRLLKLYHSTHLRCPHVTIHSFVKFFSDIHRVPFKSYLSRQFSIALDLYLSILNSADRLVQVSLERDAADYRIKHLCPPCTYILEGEKKLKFSMLYTVDGNDSLKRILRREEAPGPTVQAPAAPATREEAPDSTVQASAAPATTEEGLQLALPLLGPSS